MFGKTDYFCSLNGNIAGGGKFWGTGESRRTNLSTCVGALIGVHDMFSYKRLAVTAGISTVKFHTASFTCGVGVKF